MSHLLGLYSQTNFKRRLTKQDCNYFKSIRRDEIDT